MDTLLGHCPICGEQVALPANTEVSEIASCSSCNNRVVVEKITKDKAVLNEAPKIEEDWGE